VPPIDTKPLANLYWSLIATTVLAAMVVVSTLWLGARTKTENEWVGHTLAVRNQTEQVMILVQRAETGQRGYLRTRRDAYLIPYDEAVAALPATLDQTATMVADNPRQQQAVGRLRQLIADKLRELRATIDEQKAGRPEAAIAIVNTDEADMRPGLCGYSRKSCNARPLAAAARLGRCA
jgi:CHASE3 domain sensor protein